MIHFQRIPYFHGAKAKVDLDFLGMAKDLREQFLWFDENLINR